MLTEKNRSYIIIKLITIIRMWDVFGKDSPEYFGFCGYVQALQDSEIIDEKKAEEIRGLPEKIFSLYELEPTDEEFLKSCQTVLDEI